MIGTYRSWLASPTIVHFSLKIILYAVVTSCVHLRTCNYAMLDYYSISVERTSQTVRTGNPRAPFFVAFHAVADTTSSASLLLSGFGANSFATL